MKKKIILFLMLAFAISCLFICSVNATVAIYDDAPERVNIEVREDDIVVFDDGYSCLSAYVFKDITSLPKGKGYNPSLDDACDFTYINTKTGKNYSFNNIVSFDIPQGVTSIGDFACTALTKMKKITIPDTVTTIGSSAFQESTSLELCLFEHNESSLLDTLPPAMFSDCKSLKSLSIPDCVTTIAGPNTFAGCNSMTAMYLSKNLKAITCSNPDKSAFGSNNVYFVSEPFTDVIPEKCDVYYFPQSLEVIGEGCTFRWWNNLNKVLVFGENLTAIPNCYAFENSAQKTIVFLGDMTEVNLSDCGATSVYFANKNDTDAEQVGLNITRLKGDGSVAKKWSGTAYFCNAEGNTNHLAEKIIEVEAKCESDAGVVTVCYCGYEISKEAVAGTALEHDYDYKNNDKAILEGIVYSNYSQSGVKTVTCAKCGKSDEFSAPSLFTKIGYSVPEFTDGSIVIGFLVNKAAIDEYENTGKTISFGVFVGLESVIQSNDIFDRDGNKLEGVLSAPISKNSTRAFELKIVGFQTAEQKNASLAMGAYVATTIDGVTEYSYMQDGEAGESEKYYFATFNEITGTSAN